MIRPLYRPQPKKEITDNPEEPQNKQTDQTNPENTDINNIEKSQHPEKTAEQKKKIRCKKWPNCKNEACEFGHPSETVNF
jgi:hypothetical protein